MKTPEEIKKKIIEAYANIFWAAKNNDEHEIRMASVDGHEALKDALAYIQQLEAERDAAIGDIRLAYESYVGRCETCKHVAHQVDCDEPEDCGLCKVEDCPCRTCGKEDRNWEWRGVQKEE